MSFIKSECCNNKFHIEDDPLVRTVMRRVRIMYALRQTVAPTMLRWYAFLCAAVSLTSMISVRHILSNMPPATHPSDLANFAITAALHTQVAVQVLLAVALGMLLWQMFGLIRSPIRFSSAFLRTN